MRYCRLAATVVSTLAIGVAPWMTACQPIATELNASHVLEGEEGSEPLTLSVSHRAPVAGERLPRVRVEPAAGSLQIRVERAAFCNTQARAAIVRAPGQLTVVAHVGPDPAANCTPTINSVVEYGGVISGLTAGRYRVWVYEGVGVRRPRLMAVAKVTVPAS
jgi:hypothetical protein